MVVVPSPEHSVTLFYMGLQEVLRTYIDDILTLNAHRNPVESRPEIVASYVAAANIKTALDASQHSWGQLAAAKIKLLTDKGRCRDSYPRHLLLKGKDRIECETAAHFTYARTLEAVNDSDTSSAQEQTVTSFGRLKGGDHDNVGDLCRVAKATLHGDKRALQLYLIRENPNLLVIAMLDEGKVRARINGLDRIAITSLLDALNSLLGKHSHNLLHTTQHLVATILKRITYVKGLLYDMLRDPSALRTAIRRVRISQDMRSVLVSLVEEKFVGVLHHKGGQVGGSVRTILEALAGILIAIPVAPLIVITIMLGIASIAAQMLYAMAQAEFDPKRKQPLETLLHFKEQYLDLRRQVEGLLLSNVHFLTEPSKVVMRAFFSGFEVLFGAVTFLRDLPGNIIEEQTAKIKEHGSVAIAALKQWAQEHDITPEALNSLSGKIIREQTAQIKEHGSEAIAALKQWAKDHNITPEALIEQRTLLLSIDDDIMSRLHAKEAWLHRMEKSVVRLASQGQDVGRGGWDFGMAIVKGSLDGINEDVGRPLYSVSRNAAMAMKDAGLDVADEVGDARSVTAASFQKAYLASTRLGSSAFRHLMSIDPSSVVAQAGKLLRSLNPFAPKQVWHDAVQYQTRPHEKQDGGQRGTRSGRHSKTIREQNRGSSRARIRVGKLTPK